MSSNNNNNNAVPPAGNAGNAGGGGGGGGRRGGGGGGGGGGRGGGGGGGTGRGGRGGIASSRPTETTSALPRQDNKVSKKKRWGRQALLPKPAILTMLFDKTNDAEIMARTEEDMPEGMAVLSRPTMPTLPPGSNFGVWKDAVMTTGFKADLPSMMATITDVSRGAAPDTPATLFYFEDRHPNGRNRDIRADFAERTAALDSLDRTRIPPSELRPPPQAEGGAGGEGRWRGGRRPTERRQY